MTDKVCRAIDRYSMLSEGDSVICALSGGADSVALLHVLYSIKEKYKLMLYAAHLNHGIRGAEAERDEKFCKILCKKYKIELFTEKADIPSLSAKKKISEELCGRQERYAFFERLSEKLCARVATAHTASDNAETLLFNLTRGASVPGASGIPPVRGRFIRPLINCTRSEIEAYCEKNGLEYVTDSTNLTDDYTRNRIRHRVIPELKELNPRFEAAITRFCEDAALTDSYLSSQAKKLIERSKTAYGFRADVLKAAHQAVRNKALAQLCSDLARFSAESRHIDLLNGILSGGAVDLGAFTAICKQGLLRFSEKKPDQQFTEVPLNGFVSFEYGGLRVTASIDNSNLELNDLVFRQRQGGDRFTFPKRSVTKPLRKAFNEKKIPAEQRDEMVLLCRGSDVLWCGALGFSEQGENLRNTHMLTVIIDKKGE